MRSAVTLLLDRDGTLVHDVPYNNDVSRLRVIDGVRDALKGVRARGIQLAIVSNQSAIARGLATPDVVDAFNGSLAEAIGGVDLTLVCPHLEGCTCRKPAPGLLLEAMELLGSSPEQTIMVGDIESDIAAADAAGTHSILVPTEKTRSEEIERARVVRHSFADAMAAVCAFYETGRLV